MAKTLKTFLVEYNHALEGEKQFFLCEAEDEDHAIEQVMNAYEDCSVFRVGHVQWYAKVEVSDA